MSEEKKEQKPGYIEIIQALEKLDIRVESIIPGDFVRNDMCKDFITIVIDKEKGCRA